MTEYIVRLERCGIPAHDAIRIWYTMLRDFDLEALEEYIRSLEDECYVGRIQP